MNSKYNREEGEKCTWENFQASKSCECSLQSTLALCVGWAGYCLRHPVLPAQCCFVVLMNQFPTLTYQVFLCKVWILVSQGQRVEGTVLGLPSPQATVSWAEKSVLSLPDEAGPPSV